MARFELRRWNIIVNVTSLVEFHQKKRHDEADGSPFEGPNDGIKHPGSYSSVGTEHVQKWSE